MKRLPTAVLLATWLAACGGGDDDVEIVDSGPAADAVPSQCDPVAQTGCAEGEKCAQLTISAGPPLLARTACVDNGTVELGGDCETGDPGEATGFDDCLSEPDLGAQCINGICKEICTTPTDTCTDGFACSFYEGLFVDVASADIGVCDETCNPVTQDCAREEDGCFLDPRSGRNGVATCAGIGPETMEATQGMPCIGPDAETCFLNGCAEGFHPVIIDIPPEGGSSTCTAYCQPVDTYVNDPDGDGTPDPVKGGPKDGLIGNAVGFDDEDPKTPAVDCSADRIGVADHQCRFFQQVGDRDGGLLDYIPAEYGFCLDALDVNLEFYGNCAQTRYERQFKAYDEGFPPGDPKTIGDAGRDAYCTENPDHCGAFCTSNEVFETLADAYCKANKKSPICEPAARSRRAMWRVYAGRLGATLVNE